MRLFRWASTFTLLLCVAYGIGVVTTWMLIRFAGDRWWPATVLLFFPRWVWGVPALGLLPLTLLFRRRWAWAPFVFGLSWALSCDLRVSRSAWSAVSRQSDAFRIVTANLHGGQANGLVINDFLEKTQPDIVALQEYDRRTKIPYIHQPGWHLQQFSHMVLASRWPVTLAAGQLLDNGKASRLEVQMEAEIWAIAVPFDIDVPGGPVRVVSLHLASPHQALGLIRHQRDVAVELLKGNSERRAFELKSLRAEADVMGGKVILVGDFNTPADSPIFRDSFAGYTDAFDAIGFGFGTSYAKHHTSLRIDHVLYAAGWKCRRCYSGPDVGSGHRAVLAEMTR